MRIERVKNASRNMVYGIASQIVKQLLPFAMRTVMLYVLGVEYLGLNSLFTSVLSVLNLAELGVGAAMVYSMYQPIVDDDTDRICALMRLYKIYYRCIGLVVCAIGLALLPFIPKLINGDVPPDIDVYYLYLLNLAATVFSYWLFAYKSSILWAHQRNDVVSKVTLATDLIKYAAQLFVLVVFRNYYYYVMVILATQILNNILTAILASRMYPAYHARGTIQKNERKTINHRIRDLFSARVATVIVYSSDTIVISAFLGLKVLAIYQNYYYLFSAVASMITIVFTSVRAGLGNSFIVDTKEKITKDFMSFLLIIVWLAGFCSTCFLCVYQPFMEVWVGAGLLAEFGIVVCMSVYFFVNCMNVFFNSYKDAAGMWHKDRFRPLVEAITNLLLNVILVRYIGLYGIILSTIISMLFVAPWLIHNLFDTLFDRVYLNLFLKRMVHYVLATGITMFITFFLCSFVNLPLVFEIIIRLAICIVCANLILFAFYFKLPEFHSCIVLANRMTRGKIKVLGNHA